MIWGTIFWHENLTFFCSNQFKPLEFSLKLHPARYKTKLSLKRHLISHTEFEHECSECDRKFRKKQSLRAHMETHSGVINRPHVCDFCGKGFRRNANLMVRFEIFYFFSLFQNMPSKLLCLCRLFRSIDVCIRANSHTHVSTVTSVSMPWPLFMII